ncbi:hypothetical protein CDAR_50841 [Caerostris darwini]|uniref:LAGLIDADG homing endonuclease n=1 Tax=Caerostris darwini TaxID=1538125 RepID=A0AAV4U5N3_9ARAC|nr:hypothetical protein CDAR_50841 [Caerostris darwini]
MFNIILLQKLQTDPNRILTEFRNLIACVISSTDASTSVWILKTYHNPNETLPSLLMGDFFNRKIKKIYLRRTCSLLPPLSNQTALSVRATFDLTDLPKQIKP